MAGKTDVFENDSLKLEFNNTPISLIGDAPGIQGSATVGNLYISLHTADPTDAGTQLTNEANYTSYARVATPRTTAAWTVSTDVSGVTKVSPTVTISFPTATGGTSTPTHFGVGTAPSGAGKLMYVGTLSPVVTITNGITPQLTTATAIVVD